VKRRPAITGKLARRIAIAFAVLGAGILLLGLLSFAFNIKRLGGRRETDLFALLAAGAAASGALAWSLSRLLRRTRTGRVAGWHCVAAVAVIVVPCVAAVVIFCMSWGAQRVFRPPGPLPEGPLWFLRP